MSDARNRGNEASDGDKLPWLEPYREPGAVRPRLREVKTPPPAKSVPARRKRTIGSSAGASLGLLAAAGLALGGYWYGRNSVGDSDTGAIVSPLPPVGAERPVLTYPTIEDSAPADRLAGPVEAPVAAAPERAVAKAPVRRPAPVATRPLDAALTAPVHTPSTHDGHRRAIERICTAFIALEAELDALDAKIGDGDTGSTFATAARAIENDLDALPFADPGALCAALSERLSKVMGGSSGILLAIFTAAAGARFHDWPTALRNGLRAVQHYGGARAGDRTMLDAFIPALEVLEAKQPLASAAAAARAGANATATMAEARAGRSSYVRAEALAGVPDPGAIAVAAAFEALA